MRRRWIGTVTLAAALVLSGCSRYELPSDSQEPVLQATEAVGGNEDREQERQPVKVRGIYVSAYVAGNEAVMDSIIAQIDETELNAVVIDFKDDNGRITAKIDSEIHKDIGARKAYIPDLEGLMKKLKSHGIYTIARVAAFRDPYLAEQKPEWSLKTKSGEIYRDKDGLAWVNPYCREVWEYLAETGRQAGKAGFDEVQFDYIRFSTDSAMEQAALDESVTGGQSKTEIITEFTKFISQELSEEGLFVSADVFGAVIASPVDAEAVGQDYSAMAASLDYICPMIYPSHYGDGNFGLDHPDLYPYETILGALRQSAAKLEAGAGSGRQAVVRPWLQDFTASYLEDHREYGDEEVRQQIQAVQDAGCEEWILWSAANKYHYGALEPGEAEEEFPAGGDS